ncbi:basic amino acid ABC transporter substrate-binding protein [Thermicanus aegyptius]|uniref:basic amino acid ABC transporter substrate-binding protein n=1 Tax=Thermicanus aegyptius TaxID=94009 RepID=UPI0004912AF8|nr:basic amino acid ABC transporter substrate-binding protein [Thermicanus aegyptius]
MKKMLLAVILVVFFAVSLAGCGTKATTGDANSSDGTAETMVVGTDTSFPPFEYVDPDTNQYTGFDIELIYAIADATGLKVDLKPMEFKAIVPGLQTGTLDVGIAGMTITEERKKAVLFSEPYFQAGLVIAVRPQENKIHNKDDLKGKTIAVKLGTTSEKMAREIEGATVKTFDNGNDVYLEVIHGGADALIEDLPVIKHYIVKNPDKLVVVSEPMTGDNYGIAVTKSKTQLLEKINEGLKKVKESGKYDELYKKYFGE